MGKANGLEARGDIIEILNTVSSDKVDTRARGLKDLVPIIKADAQKPRKQQISDKGYHTILESLFRSTKYEVAHYARASKSSGIKAESRLATCASLLRTIVETQVRKLGAETVKALMEHIRQSLHTSNSSYCDPLIFDYVRSLLHLLEYKAHVENLSSEEMHATIDLCLALTNDLCQVFDTETIQSSLNTTISVNSHDPHSVRTGRSVVASMAGKVISSHSKESSQHMAYPQLQSSAAGIVSCLQNLASVPNVPLLDRADGILAAMFNLLESYPNVNTIQRPAFETIDSLVPRVFTSNIELALRATRKCVLLIRSFWQTRAPGMKEVLLSILLHGEPLLPLLISKDDTGNCSADLSAVVEVLRQEYTERRPKDSLLMEDIDLSDYSHLPSSRPPLRCTFASLRSGSIKAEVPWCLLSLSAAIVVMLDEDLSSGRPTEATDEVDGRLAKRQRLTRQLDELSNFIKSSRVSLKIYGLQVLAFVLERHTFDSTELLEILELLGPSLSDEDGTTTTWALFATSCATSQVHAGETGLKEIWLRTWRTGFRQITFPGTCKAACHLCTVLLDTGIIEYREVTDLIDGIFMSPDLNGPADCDGAATHFWQVLLVLRGQENLNSVAAMSETILLWLFKRWSPATIVNRHQTMYKAQHFSVLGVLGLLCNCMGIFVAPNVKMTPQNLGRLHQTYIGALRNKELTTYLAFDGHMQEKRLNSMPKLKSCSLNSSLSSTGSKTLASTTLELLTSECSHLFRECFADPTKAASIVNSEVIRTTTSLCIIGYSVLSEEIFPNSERSETLRKALDKLRGGLKVCLLQHDRRAELLDGLLDAFGELPCSINQQVSGNDPLIYGAIAMSHDLNPKFWEDISSIGGISNGFGEPEPIDIDIDFGSQTKQERSKDHAIDLIHTEIPATTSPETFKVACVARICFMSMLAQSVNERVPNLSLASTAFVTYLTDLKRHEFLLCRSVLHEFLTSGLPLTEDDADSLLQYLSQTYTQRYETQRSEVAIGTCLDAMTDLATLWTVAESECAGAGAELYIWFMSVIMNGDPISTHVCDCAASLFQTMIRIAPEYAKGLSLASSRTSLFEVLRTGSLIVKFRISKDIASVFGLFVLKEHDHILEDVIDTLPSDPHWIEGIALRLLMLARLAASWSTLLRRCIYAIFETPGHVSQSTGYAKHCLRYVSDSLGLLKCQHLLELFASQIIYTWLETEALGNMPYSIFEYTSLKLMLEDVQDEVLGQVVMRGKEPEAAQLIEDLGSPFDTLVEQSFAKATAYSIARDIALPPNGNIQAVGAEARLRKMLGKERYASLVTTHFSEIIALFYTTMDYEEQIEKPFSKRPEYSAAKKAYEEMIEHSASSKVLPPNQQPSFKARYLVDEIEHLCRRTSYDPERIWTPTLYIYIFRRLLSIIQPAFGSLHACSALRKIRILISMAGSTALEHYPLEMALHALKPFLTDIQCAEDTIGMFRYLVAHGSTYLSEVPAFLAGNAVMTFISMRIFLESTQDSTTQESQFRSTLTKARTLHAWFASYLREYTSVAVSKETMDSFRDLVATASKISTQGNARLGTYESELILQVFEDERAGKDLLSASTRNSILKNICCSFEKPPDFRQDILGDEERAAVYAPIIWKSCQEGLMNPNYVLWCSRVLGRAYAAEGHIDKAMILEINSEPRTQDKSQQTSQVTVLQIICGLLQSNNQEEIGVAEAILRSVVTAARGDQLFVECEQVMPPSLMKSMFWSEYCLPKVSAVHTGGESLESISSAGFDGELTTSKWIQRLAISLCKAAQNDPLLSALPIIMQTVQSVSEKIFPYILHLVLLKEVNGQQTSRAIISKACQDWFQICLEKNQGMSSVRILLSAILYLHTQPMPHERVKADRTQWLDIDYRQAASVASRCAMYKTSLMFLEIGHSELLKADGAISRRESRHLASELTQDSSDLLLLIYQHVDEQDAFYGVKQPSSLSSMMHRLDYEHAGFKSLSFRGAYYDSELRRASGDSQVDADSMVRALDNLDLNGLSQSMLSKVNNAGAKSVDAALQTARKLEKWDISAPSTHLSPISSTFRVFQELNNASETAKIDSVLQVGFSSLMNQLLAEKAAKSSMNSVLVNLAILAEADEIFTSRGPKQLQEVAARFETRNYWMHMESFDRVNAMLSCRETSFGSLTKRQTLQNIVKTSLRDCRALEARVLLMCSQMSRSHNALQNALTTATYLNQIVDSSKAAGVEIDAAVRFESANVLWEQGEMTASIRMLQDLAKHEISQSEVMRPGKAELLAKLGHRISEARLEKPDEIIRTYLVPAIDALGGTSEGPEAGEVFHEFASFCDQQLQNSDNMEDFQRIKRLRERKVSEVQDLEGMIRKAPSQGKEKDNLRNHRNKAKLWLDLDDQEYQRLRDSRQTFLKQSLENYLLCLKASDKFDNDALRFSALWLENHDSEIANAAVAKHIAQVGTRKFAPLMNQWSSRLLDDSSPFQKILFHLVFRICVEHPYHGMYQIFASSKSKGGKDETAMARYNAANAIVDKLKNSKRVSQIWISLHNTNVNFVRLASERLEDAKPGAKLPLRKSANGSRIEQDVRKYQVPPPTITIQLRPDCDYSSIPTIDRFLPEFTLAGGISAPKIITAMGSDGRRYKQLFKGGNDDLRQDAIMEQVFAAVSALLATQRPTRQRALKIRTYKVLPLTATAGIIEFVPNTVPLHDYLLPAHQRHHPRDLKPSVCRKYIADVQSSPIDTRIKQFHKVTQQFHPVLRYFFFERFESPDAWFDTRLAYTRSTAAISILGHILGLGDRHGHNILLDETTGEVVHIDLGIAFEQGRVLPVPEVVPFRLTRDLVDAMGCTGTEGVFRRCCEFTLEALRNESYSIMTILDVLRYDPLYSWSLSPLRMKKLQEQGDEGGGAPGVDGDGERAGGRKAADSEPGEADRALTIVKKKLSKSLSVQATVNELISTATDERNLAVLFCGWAAYA